MPANHLGPRPDICDFCQGELIDHLPKYQKRAKNSLLHMCKACLLCGIRTTCVETWRGLHLSLIPDFPRFPLGFLRLCLRKFPYLSPVPLVRTCLHFPSPFPFSSSRTAFVPALIYSHVPAWGKKSHLFSIYIALLEEPPYDSSTRIIISYQRDSPRDPTVLQHPLLPLVQYL